MVAQVSRPKSDLPCRMSLSQGDITSIGGRWPGSPSEEPAQLSAARPFAPFA